MTRVPSLARGEVLNCYYYQCNQENRDTIGISHMTNILFHKKSHFTTKNSKSCVKVKIYPCYCNNK